jgi:hypothetical protein
MQFLEQDEDPNVFWGKVKTNLQAGKVRLVFVADEIPSELRRIVEFLNGQMDPAEVLALEVPQYVGGSLKSLVPRVIGQTAEAQQKKSVGQRVTRQWDEASFFEELLKARGEEETQVARAILEWTRASIPRATWWGRGQSLGAYVPVLDHKGIEARLVSLFTNGTLQIAFRYMQHRPPFDNRRKREELLERLNGIPGVSLPSESIENRSPSIPYSALKETSTLKHFLEVLEWAVEQVRAV